MYYTNKQQIKLKGIFIKSDLVLVSFNVIIILSLVYNFDNFQLKIVDPIVTKNFNYLM